MSKFWQLTHSTKPFNLFVLIFRQIHDHSQQKQLICKQRITLSNRNDHFQQNKKLFTKDWFQSLRINGQNQERQKYICEQILQPVSLMSEEINPWTHRRQKSPTLLSPKKEKSTRPVLKERILIKNRVISESDMRQTIQKPIDLPLLQPQAILRAKRLINQKLAENLGISLSLNQQSNFLPNYKFVNLCFGNRSPKRNKKDRKVPYHINSLRQYTDNHDIRNENDLRNRSEVGRISKIRRYFTQQKNQNTINSEETSIQVQSCLTRASKEKPQTSSRNNPSLRLISKKHRSIEQSEKLIQKGKLYEEIDKLCNIKPMKSNKMTFMKRTYNLKRLEKILL